MNPHEQTKFLTHIHRDIDIPRNLEILFAGAKIGDQDFLDLYNECLRISQTEVGTWKTFRRAQRALGLARYFDYSLSLEGARAECGVLRGFSALLLARVAKLHDADFDGQGLHLIDSFEGLSAPSPADAIGSKRGPDGSEEPVYSHQAGHFATPMDFVRSVMGDFPASGIHKGWIPEAFADLPETKWAFVHIDVDLYEPTKACLDYFLPRMAPGGVIVNDDFESPWFPGCGIGWHETLESKGLSYIALDTGQAVYIHNS